VIGSMCSSNHACGAGEGTLLREKKRTERRRRKSIGVWFVGRL
jgi:hypothetical protein